MQKIRESDKKEESCEVSHSRLPPGYIRAARVILELDAALP